MFKNTAMKIKVCAYIFFGASALMEIYRKVNHLAMLGFPSSMIFSEIMEILLQIFCYFVISLLIYGIGNIVSHFENLNGQNKV